MLETIRSLFGKEADRHPPRDPETPPGDSEEERARREAQMDEVLAQTFPDPPAWTSIRESEEHR